MEVFKIIVWNSFQSSPSLFRLILDGWQVQRAGHSQQIVPFSQKKKKNAVFPSVWIKWGSDSTVRCTCQENKAITWLGLEPSLLDRGSKPSTAIKLFCFSLDLNVFVYNSPFIGYLVWPLKTLLTLQFFLIVFSIYLSIIRPCIVFHVFSPNFLTPD